MKEGVISMGKGSRRSGGRDSDCEVEGFRVQICNSVFIPPAK